MVATIAQQETPQAATEVENQTPQQPTSLDVLHLLPLVAQTLHTEGSKAIEAQSLSPGDAAKLVAFYEGWATIEPTLANLTLAGAKDMADALFERYVFAKSVYAQALVASDLPPGLKGSISHVAEAAFRSLGRDEQTSLLMSMARHVGNAHGLYLSSRRKVKLEDGVEWRADGADANISIDLLMPTHLGGAPGGASKPRPPKVEGEASNGAGGSHKGNGAVKAEVVKVTLQNLPATFTREQFQAAAAAHGAHEGANMGDTLANLTHSKKLTRNAATKEWTKVPA